MKKSSFNSWKLLALLWAFVLLGAIFLLLRPSDGPRFETSLLALLPSAEQKPLVERAVSQMAQETSSRVILLAGNSDLDAASKAADLAAAALLGKTGIHAVISKIEGDPSQIAQAFYFPYRYQILGPQARQKLQSESDAALLQDALEAAYSPLGPPRMAALDADPLGFYSETLLEAASRSAFRVEASHLAVDEGPTHWVAVLVEVDSGMSVGEQETLLDEFKSAEAAARSVPGTDYLRAGFVFHAAEAAKEAQGEVSTIGLGSMLGILILVFFAFRSIKPLFLVALPVLCGSLVALGYSPFLIGRPHLLTLVFGTSIIGVAVDYGVLFLSGSASSTPWNAAGRRRQILRPVAMAVGTSLIAYASLASLPFPILRQMGIFTILGLAAAWLTAMLWLPLFAERLPDVSQGSFLKFLSRCEVRWPRFEWKGKRLWLWLLAFLVLGIGALRLKSNDDVRQLYASDPETQREEQRIQSLLQLPAAGQFFVIEGKDEEAILEAEESLEPQLDAMRQKGSLANYQGVCNFVPSAARQQADAALLQRRLFAPHALVQKFFDALQSPALGRKARREAKPSSPPLNVGLWLASPFAAPFRGLWLGQSDGQMAAILSLSAGPAGLDLKALEALANPDAGISFVDHFAALDAMMGSFRRRVAWLLLFGYLLVSLFVAWIYGRDGWRAMAPALLGALLVAGLFGWLGLNFNLFSVFGILLSLDMGVDYGIFMQDRQSGEFPVALLSASLAALSTLLSFGLLCLSRTPALQVFGLSVLLGIGAAWLLAPAFTKESKHEQS